MTSCRLCLLIPHHDDVAGLLRSLQSVDEPMPVDVLVVDDGSPAPPDLEHLQAALGDGGTVHLEVLGTNRGIAGALNVGLERCLSMGYEFIGRLDAGDRNRRGRLAAQVAALDAEPAIGVVGTWVQTVDPWGRPLFVMQPPAGHEDLVRRLSSGNPMPHPSLVFRSSVLSTVDGYPEDLPAAEDFGMIARLATRTRLAIVPAVLVDKELDPHSISATRRRDQVRSRIRVIAALPAPRWRRAVGIARNLVLMVLSRDLTTRIKLVWGRGSTDQG